MKTINTLLALSALYIFTSVMTADELNGDALLAQTLVGHWEHVSSTYPNGDVLTYNRDIELKSDGTGFCTKYMEEDTLGISFRWEVKDSVIHLFVFDKHGRRIEADAQLVSGVSASRMYLTDAYGEDQTGKICCYSREHFGEGAKF